MKRAQQERDAATLKLAEVEQRLAKLDTEVDEIRKHTIAEAEEERERIRQSAEQDVIKLREQARELETTQGRTGQQRAISWPRRRATRGRAAGPGGQA